MRSFNCLDPDQSIDGKIFLEASAGTGKTFAIEHIVCRLILQGHSLKQILITTFTKKGVRDLKRRIFENLCKTHALLKSTNPLPHYLEKIEDRRGAILNLETNLSIIEEAEIHTIHSFCFRMLSEYAFEAGISLSQDDPESDEKQNEVRSAILDTLRTTLDDQEFSPSQLLRLMAHFTRDVQKLVSKIASFLASDHTIVSYPAYTKQKETYNQILKSIDVDLLKNDLYALSTLYKKCANKSGERFAFVNDQIENIENIEILIVKTPSIFELFSATNLKKGKTQKDLSLHYEEEIERMKEVVCEISDPLITFIRICEKAKSRLDTISMKNPNYLLDAMAARLTNRSLIEKIRNRFNSIIIDEFQDTDPTQWDIFSTIFLEKANPFVVVGDPKQSIYAFRGAKLETYLHAKNAFDHHYLLSTNYRSDKTIIDTLNSLFDEKQIEGIFSFEKGDSSLVHKPVLAGCSTSEQSGVQVILSNNSEDSLMRFMADEICRLKQEKGHNLCECAILVKDRFQAERMTKILAEKKIAVLSTATGSILESAAFCFVEISLKLAQSIRNTSLFNQFLFHPFVGWPIEMITPDLSDPLLTEAITRFAAIATLFEEKDASTFFRALLQETFFTCPIIENIAKDSAAYSDLMQTIELIFTLDRNHPLDAIKILKKKDELASTQLRRKPLNDKDAVTLMTMHMSKGLEFDIVFPIGMISPTKTKQEFTKTSQNQILRFSSSDPRAQKQLRDLDCEKMRLLYVALTRAKKRLYLPFLLETRKSPPKLGTASPSELFLTRLVSKHQLSLQETYDNIANTTEEETIQTLEKLSIPVKNIDCEYKTSSLDTLSTPPVIPDPLVLILKEKNVITTSFSSMATPSHSSPPLEHDENILPHGAATGNIFHLLFEKIIENGLYAPWDQHSIDALIEKDLAFSHLCNWNEEVKELVHAAFHTDLMGFSLANISPQDMIQEAPFLFEMESGLNIKGFADLIFRHEEKFYILDWKLNRLPEYTQETIENAMCEHDYKKQASVYTEALKRYTSLIDASKPFEAVFGGSIYFFLRGKENGVYLHSPERLELIL